MNFRLKILVFFLLLVSQIKVHSQEEWGGKVGLAIQIGSHVNRIGAMYQLYYFNQNVQFSHGNYIHFGLKSLGPKGKHLEMKWQFGVQGHWTEADFKKFYFNEFSNLSPYRNSIGYSFYVYFDSKKTSQTTGALNINVDNFQFYLDNDAFGLNQVDDKFRTGGLYVGYQVDSSLFGLQATLWTGKSSDGPRIDDSNYPSRFGYRDVTKAEYGNSSHGIFALRADQILEFDQSVRGELGFDAERVRHILQNKLIHDGISGRLVMSESPHYPMLQKDGSMYLFREAEKVKAMKPYLQVSGNQSAFY